MTQRECAQIRRAAERIDEISVAVLRDRIDGEIAPSQVFFERDAGICIEREPVIAASGFAFGARLRIFLARLRMQKHREILADRRVALAQQFVRRRADDDVVAILHRNAEQTIAHRAADEISLHPRIMRSGAHNFTLLARRRR
jgi:hypothetical protein